MGTIADLPTTEAEAVPMEADRTVGWQHLRAIGPIVRIKDALWVTRQDDVEHILRTPEVFSSKKAFDQLGSPLPLVPLSFDPPEHTRFRRILQPFFSPRALNGALPSLQRQAGELIDAIPATGPVELMRALAIPYPSQVFLTLFGLPLEDRERLIGWKDKVIELSTAGASGIESADLGPALELFAYLTEAVAAKRTAPADDILSELLVGDEALTDEEALGLCFLFVLAGLDTVTASLGFAFEHLARNPERRRALVADSTLIPHFAEEIVRLEPPAPTLPRVTTQEVEIAGTTVPADTLLYVCIGAANREPGSLPVPDDVQDDDVTHRHWGFGGGPHRCLGSHLARLELKLVLEHWHRRFPEYSIEPGTQPKIIWPSGTFALESLHLAIG